MTYGRNFWRQALERAIKTAAQTGVLALGGDIVNKVPSLPDNPSVLLGALAGGALLSLLTSMATAGVGPKDDPSAVATTTP